MTKPAIEINNLSKSYIISHQKEVKKHSVVRNVMDTIQKPLGGGGPGYTHETFWALKGVSFNVEQGEVFGVLGKNGSGKSTLLKILSRIVDPTEGSIKIRGRVASLLEVGTGFHPELTGRENVFLNGSMLGLSRQEIIKKFDEIVEFSEIEKFIDTPVKFYSSGMYVRLAFSVAAHLESDILILDEVLSVGDAAFQKKSMDKILSTIKEGRTVLYVSHSMDTIKRLCNRAVLLEKGEIKYLGDAEFVSDKYLGTNMKIREETLFEEEKNKQAQFLETRIMDTQDNDRETLEASEAWRLFLRYKVNHPCERTIVGVEIMTQEGQTIYMTSSTDLDRSMGTLEPGTYASTLDFDKFHFIPGVYHLRVTIQSPGIKMYDNHESLVLRIKDNPKDIRTKYFKGKYFGFVAEKIKWDTEKQ